MSHFKLSMIKSAFRIVGAGFLVFHCYVTTAAMFIIAEVIGIFEEIVEK
jgi:hypothetical protein